MAKSKRERRSSIRHMAETDDTSRLFEALERAERESPTSHASEETESEDLDEDHEEAPSR